MHSKKRDMPQDWYIYEITLSWNQTLRRLTRADNRMTSNPWTTKISLKYTTTARILHGLIFQLEQMSTPQKKTSILDLHTKTLALFPSRPPPPLPANFTCKFIDYIVWLLWKFTYRLISPRQTHLVSMFNLVKLLVTLIHWRSCEVGGKGKRAKKFCILAAVQSINFISTADKPHILWTNDIITSS